MSRKFLVTIVLILFLLPFVSWYYLQSGLEWRKDAQEVMNGKTPFPSGTCVLADGRKFSADSLEGRVTLIAYVSCDTDDKGQKDVLEALYDQFRETSKAAFVLLDTCQAGSSFSIQKQHKYWYVIPCSDSIAICSAVHALWEKDKMFALVDRKGVIRSYYAINTTDEKRILVEHMSLLLPRERQEKVELKRGDKK
ncbi:MAG: hypothetical protein SH808_09165 [Saprospiraceae bacterium]|nr:hypothetical protein [Saprospiraceae bacterium]